MDAAYIHSSPHRLIGDGDHPPLPFPCGSEPMGGTFTDEKFISAVADQDDPSPTSGIPLAEDFVLHLTPKGKDGCVVTRGIPPLSNLFVSKVATQPTLPERPTVPLTDS